VQLGQSVMGDFTLFEKTRNDTPDLASGIQDGIGRTTHEPDVTASEDKADTPFGKPFAEDLRYVEERFRSEVARTAINGD